MFDVTSFATGLRAAFLISLFSLLHLTAASGQVTWTPVPTPNPSTVRNQLRGISGTSSNDIWAVGHYQPNPANLVYDNLLLHWNGTGWQTASVANPGSALNDLYGVKVINANLAWAVGQYTNTGVAQPQLVKWNGSSWTHESIGQVAGGAYLFGIGAVSATDVWAVGGKAGSPFLSYALHYNGSSWNEVPVPPAPNSGLNNFNAVHGLAANDVWAVGSWGVAVGDYHFLAMHWNGSTWVNSPIPATVNNGIDGELWDVKMVSSNDVWAVGYSLAGGVVTLHYDGTGWTEVPSPGGGGALAVLSTNNIYSVGGNITHWNGSSWTVADTLMPYPWPALIAATVLPNGAIWAAGRTVDSNNVYRTLVYRTGPNVTTGIAGMAADMPRFAVYPNPFDEVVRITATNAIRQQVRMTLTDISGRVLLRKSSVIGAGSEGISLTIPASVPAGLYLLQLEAGDKTQLVRLTKR